MRNSLNSSGVWRDEEDVVLTQELRLLIKLIYSVTKPKISIAHHLGVL